MRRIVVDLLAEHRSDDAQLVGDAADVREDLGHLVAGLAELLERELRPVAHQLLPLQLRERCCPLVIDSGIGWPFIAASFGL